MNYKVLAATLLLPLTVFAEQKELYVEVTYNKPGIGVETEVYLGDRMLAQQTGEWKECITPQETYTDKFFGGGLVTYKAGEPMCKMKPDSKYYSPNYDNVKGFGNTSLSQAVAWKKDGKNTFKLCRCPMGCSDCVKKLPKEAVNQGEAFIYKKNSLQQTIEYSGKKAEILTFTYSEFYDGYAREAFNREFTLDLTDGYVLGYKGAIIEVIEATNMTIRYKVTRNFQD